MDRRELMILAMMLDPELNETEAWRRVDRATEKYDAELDRRQKRCPECKGSGLYTSPGTKRIFKCHKCRGAGKVFKSPRRKKATA